jgi:pimeloyl-ACP methyl ester carboxylesterase
MGSSATKVPRPRVVVVGSGKVGLYEYGDPNGRPVLTFHGIPASGAGFTWADAPARARGLRVLAPDRPGVGQTSPQDGWGPSDYPAMVAALADTLGIERFLVWGYSGGGPYAAAMAALLPERVIATAISAGMGEVGTWASPEDFGKTDRQMFGLSVRHPRVARVVLGATGWLARRSPKTAYKSFAKQLDASDAAVLAQLGEPDVAIALFTEAFQRGARGVVDDYRATSGPWGIDLTSITGPVRVYQGTADTMVPFAHGEELARRIPGADFVPWPDEGHLATITHVDEILDWLSGFPA